MRDREMIKWLPFDSVISGKKMVQNIMYEKSKLAKPKLSEEQLLDLEQKIWEGFHNGIPLRIVYYFKGRYQVKSNAIIFDIQVSEKKIYFTDHSSLYFDQILRITAN